MGGDLGLQKEIERQAKRKNLVCRSGAEVGSSMKGSKRRNKTTTGA